MHTGVGQGPGGPALGSCLHGQLSGLGQVTLFLPASGEGTGYVISKVFPALRFQDCRIQVHLDAQLGFPDF